MIFQHYARDLDAVQAQYEAQKHNPPVPHNVPPTAGNIMWSRQLLSRIEEPMQLFAQNKSLTAMKESKKTIKLYNRVSLAKLSSGARADTNTFTARLGITSSKYLRACTQQRLLFQLPFCVTCDGRLPHTTALTLSAGGQSPCRV